MNYFWLSFRDPIKDRNLGVVIIEEAENVGVAVQKAHDLNINPEGEVMGCLLTQEEFDNEKLKSHKLYSREDMINMGYKMGI